MKPLKYFYVFLWIFVIPSIIGQGLGDSLLRLYHNFNEHFFVGGAVCLISGSVVTWVPMGFLIEGVEFGVRTELIALTILVWIAGCIAPILFGFQNLGIIMTVLLIFSAIFTITKLHSRPS